MRKDYFLGVHHKELERLKRQHQAWRPETIQLINDAGLTGCKNILDIGSGPGFTSFEISDQCPHSDVIALDKATLYQEYLHHEIKLKNYDRVHPLHADLLDLQNVEQQYDGAFCRWVLAFLIEDLSSVLQNIYDQLAPGGVFVAMEYLTLDSFTCSPPSECFEAYKNAWKNFYLNNGGDANIATYLPHKLEEAGFTIESIKNVGGHAPMGHRWYNWWRDAFDNFAPAFVQQGLMSEADYNGLQEYWLVQEHHSNAYMYTCVIAQIVARK